LFVFQTNESKTDQQPWLKLRIRHKGMQFVIRAKSALPIKNESSLSCLCTLTEFDGFSKMGKSMVHIHTG